jgi:hypothetical protein
VQIFAIRLKDPEADSTVLKKGIEAGERGLIDAEGPGKLLPRPKKINHTACLIPERSTQEQVMVAGTVGEDRRIENFTAGTALPCIEGANEVVILFGVHSSFAFGTFHDLFLLFM